MIASTGNFFASKPTLARTCSESTVTEYVTRYIGSKIFKMLLRYFMNSYNSFYVSIAHDIFLGNLFLVLGIF